MGDLNEPVSTQDRFVPTDLVDAENILRDFDVQYTRVDMSTVSVGLRI